MSTEPDDLDAFLAEKATDPAFALHWEALQARKRADRPAATDQEPKAYGAEPAEPEPFEGHQPRECGEHRTTGSRAWCFDCHEWCYPHSPCVRCELPVLRAELAAARASEADLDLMTAEEEDHAFLARAGGGPDPEPFRAEPKRPRRCASEAPGDAHSPTPDVGAAQGGEVGSADESEPRVHYEVEMYNDGWSIPIYRTHSVDDARAHEEPAVTSASTRIVRVTREVIQ